MLGFSLSLSLSLLSIQSGHFHGNLWAKEDQLMEASCLLTQLCDSSLIETHTDTYTPIAFNSYFDKRQLSPPHAIHKTF